MGGDKNNLVTLASKLITSIANITEDYRLGLGSFVDKPIIPFGAASEYEFIHIFIYLSIFLIINEVNSNIKFSLYFLDSYVFKNRLPLTTDTSNFANIVRSTTILSGADSYEGTGKLEFVI